MGVKLTEVILIDPPRADVIALASIASSVLTSVVYRRWQSLELFRQRIRDSGKLEPTAEDPDGAGFLGLHDRTLVRYMRARQWNLEKALAMYLDTLDWRREENADRYRRNAPGGSVVSAEAHMRARTEAFDSDGVELYPDLRLVERQEKDALYRNFCATTCCGHDKMGRPIYIEKQGEASHMFPTLMKEFGKDELIKAHVRLQELQLARMEEMEKVRGHKIPGQFIILDMGGMSMVPSSDALSVFKAVQKMDEKHYPETLGVQFTVNAPGIFKFVWAMVSPWLDPGTRRKIRIFGAKREEWEPELLKYIDADQLPEEFGGTSKAQVQAIGDREAAYELVERMNAHPVIMGTGKDATELDEPEVYTCQEHTPPPTPKPHEADSFPYGVVSSNALVFPGKKPPQTPEPRRSVDRAAVKFEAAPPPPPSKCCCTIS